MTKVKIAKGPLPGGRRYRFSFRRHPHQTELALPASPQTYSPVLKSISIISRRTFVAARISIRTVRVIG
jgi:hypothetical protein